MNPSNFIPYLQTAQRLSQSIDCRELLASCGNVLKQHLLAVSKQDNFLSMELTHFVAFLEYASNIHVYEVDLMQTIKQWLEHCPIHQQQLSEHRDIRKYGELESCFKNQFDRVCSLRRCLAEKPRLVIYSEAAMDNYTELELVLCLGGTKANGVDVNTSTWDIRYSDNLKKLCGIETKYTLRRGHSICVTPDLARLLFSGGENSDDCALYNNLFCDWLEMPNMLSKRHNHGSVFVQDKLYILGGVTNQMKTKTVEYLEFSSEDPPECSDPPIWQIGPDLPIAVENPQVAAIDNRVYVFDQETGRMFCLHIDTQQWEPLEGPPLFQFHGVSMTSALERLYLAGGRSRIFAWYDPTTMEWTIGPKPQYKHWHGALVYHNEHLHLMGGKYSECGTNKSERLLIGSPENRVGIDRCWKKSDLVLPMPLHHHSVVVALGPLLAED